MLPTSGCCSAAATTRASDALSLEEEEASPPRLRAEATTLADCLFAESTDAEEERFLPLPLLLRSSLALSSAFLVGLATATATDWRFALEEKAAADAAAGLLRASAASLDERRSSIGFFEGEQRKKKSM